MKSFEEWYQEGFKGLHQRHPGDPDWELPYEEGQGESVMCCCCENYFVADYEFNLLDEDYRHYCGGSPWCCP
jgi:hypothetical protein